MYFCDKCNTLCTSALCEVCGNTALRAPEATDFCFLTERAPMWAEMLRGALAGAGIESAYRPLLGTGVLYGAGKTLDRHQIFVPYEHYEESQAIMLTLFGETEPGRSPSSIWKR